jgi:hypothetical protein
MLDREARKVRAKVIPQVDRAVLQDAILESVSKGSTVYTDKLGAYANLNTLEFVHEIVNHIDEYVRGNVHTVAFSGSPCSCGLRELVAASLFTWPCSLS